jgi:hypothetical protein
MGSQRQDLHRLPRGALAQQLQHLCNCETDDQLPEVHGLLLKTAKGRTYALLGSLFAKRALESPLPLDASTAPLATPKLVEEVFQNYAPGGDGLTFGRGSPPLPSSALHTRVSRRHNGPPSIRPRCWNPEPL